MSGPYGALPVVWTLVAKGAGEEIWDASVDGVPMRVWKNGARWVPSFRPAAGEVISFGVRTSSLDEAKQLAEQRARNTDQWPTQIKRERAAQAAPAPAAAPVPVLDARYYEILSIAASYPEGSYAHKRWTDHAAAYKAEREGGGGR